MALVLSPRVTNHKRVYRLCREEELAVRIRQCGRVRWTGDEQPGGEETE